MASVKKAATAILMWIPALASAVTLNNKIDDHWEMLGGASDELLRKRRATSRAEPEHEDCQGMTELVEPDNSFLCKHGSSFNLTKKLNKLKNIAEKMCAYLTI